jgi:hypothetical protein
MESYVYIEDECFHGELDTVLEDLKSRSIEIRKLEVNLINQNKSDFKFTHEIIYLGHSIQKKKKKKNQA